MGVDKTPNGMAMLKVLGHGSMKDHGLRVLHTSPCFAQGASKG